MLVVMLAFSVVAQEPAPAPVTPAGPQFFDDGQPGSYLQWYGAEYVAIIAAGTLVATGATNAIEPLPASMGPSFSLTDGDLAQLNDPRLDDVIGKPMLNEKVPTAALGIGLASAVLLTAGTDFAVRQDLHRTHAIVLGGAEAIIGATMITEVLKLSVGRLRPDFRERYVRAACAGVVARNDIDCAGVLDDGFKVDREDLHDGMKSFPSGHASSSFAAATFLALQVGNDHLWNPQAEEWVRPIAGLAVGTLVAGAGYIAATRFSDHRHHLEDIAVGAGIGVASGIAAYYIHFDTQGRARKRWSDRPATTTALPLVMPGGAGVSVQGAF